MTHDELRALLQRAYARQKLRGTPPEREFCGLSYVDGERRFICLDHANATYLLDTAVFPLFPTENSHDDQALPVRP